MRRQTRPTGRCDSRMARDVRKRVGVLEEKVRPPEKDFSPKFIDLLRRIVLALLEEMTARGPLDEETVEQTW